MGDKRKIEKIFSNEQEPTILVKKNEYYPITTTTGTNYATATNDFTGANNYTNTVNDFTGTNDLIDQNNQNLYSEYENNNYDNYNYGF